MNSSVFYPYQLDLNLPELPSNCIPRESDIQTILDATSGTSIVFIEGDEGCGATTLLAQLCAVNPGSTFTLFINPASRYSYSPQSLRVSLAEQFWFFLKGVVPEHSAVDEKEFEQLVYNMRKKARKHPIYVVVDGLHQIPADAAEAALTDVLPLGFFGFRFLITGRARDLSAFVRRTDYTSCRVRLFSVDESKTMLSGLNLANDEIQSLVNLCRGIPGRLALVRRLLKNGETANSILDAEPSKYLDFIKLEFSPIAQLTEKQRLILAVLAFGKQLISKKDLVLIVRDCSESDIDALLARCTFLTISSARGSIEFISDSHRKLAQRILDSLQNSALECQIDYLKDNPESDAALQFLPAYLQALGRQQAIIELLSPEHFERLLESTHSIKELKARAVLGARNAIELGKVTSVFQFALQRSIFSALGGMGASRSEVAALVALGEKQRALDLASLAISHEARLLLLAEFARGVREKGEVLDADIVDHIRSVAASIDFADLEGDKDRLAENLLYVDVDLALAVAESLGGASTSQRDDAIARISILSSASNIPEKDTAVEKTRQKIANPSLARVLTLLNSIVSDFSVSEIKEMAGKLKFERRIAFLKSLVNAGISREGVLEVVEFALDQLVSETSYRPLARDLIELATPLTSPADVMVLKPLIERIDAQFASISGLVPSNEVARLQLALVQAEAQFDDDLSAQRLERLYDSVQRISDVEVRVECCALILQTATNISDLRWRSIARPILTATKSAIDADLQYLLKESGSHYEITEGALRALCGTDPQRAFDVAAQLNVAVRRYRAYGLIASTLIRMPFSSKADEVVRACVDRFDDSYVRDNEISRIVEAVKSGPSSSEWVPTLSWMLDKISLPVVAADAVLLIMRIRLEEDRLASIDDLNTVLAKLIDSIDSPIQRIETLYESSAIAARASVEKAVEYYEAAKSIARATILDSNASDEMMRLCLTLLLRSLKPLLAADVLDESLFARFARLVSSLPSAAARAAFFGELAVIAWCARKTDVCKKLVHEHCKPLVDSLGPSDHSYPLTISHLFVALYVSHKASAITHLGAMSVVMQEKVLRDAANVVLRKVSQYEPWAGEDYDLQINFEDATDVLEILEHAPTDSTFYSIVQSLVEAATSKASKTKINNNQRIELHRRIVELARAKLPDSRNIQHDGYLIVSIARARSLLDPRTISWNDLIAEANSLPCLADKQYVLTELADSLPSRASAERKRLLDDAYRAIDAVPSIFDRQASLRHYVEVAKKYDLPSAKAALRQALRLTFTSNQSEADERRRLVDLAETIEPGFAEKIADVLDDDPARRQAKRDIERAIEVQKFKRQIGGKPEKVEPDALTRENLPGAAWKGVGALVSGRMQPKAPDQLLDVMTAAVKLNLHEVFPVLSWYLENAARKYSSVADVRSRIVPITEVLMLSTELALSVLKKNGSDNSPILRVSQGVDDAGAVLGPRDRASAIEYIRAWISESASLELVYCDPYFGVQDIEFLKLVLSESPDCRVSILTSRKAVAKSDDGRAFVAEWNRLSDQVPPDTEIIALSELEDDRSPVHDRWLISGGSGLRLGTSFNSLGAGRITEISRLSPERCAEVMEALRPFVKKERFVDGARIQYASYVL